MQEIYEVFCGDVSRGPRRERAPARAPHRGVEHRRAALDGRCGVRYARVARVVEVAADGYAVGSGALYQLPHLARNPNPDGVGQHDLVRNRLRDPACDPEYVLGLDPSLERVPKSG